jgi:hypothetical protein
MILMNCINIQTNRWFSFALGRVGAIVVSALIVSCVQAAERPVTVCANGSVTNIFGGAAGYAGMPFSCSFLLNPEELTLLSGNGSNSPTSVYKSTNTVYAETNGVLVTYSGYVLSVSHYYAGSNAFVVSSINVGWGPGNEDGVFCDFPASSGSDDSISAIMEELSLGLDGAYHGASGFSAGCDEGRNSGVSGQLFTFFDMAPTLTASLVPGTAAPSGLPPSLLLTWPTNNSSGFFLESTTNLLGTNWVLSGGPGGRGNEPTNWGVALSSSQGVVLFRLANTNYPTLNYNLPQN